MSKFHARYFILALVLFAAGGLEAAQVASVGAGGITEQDISDGQAAQSCYGEDAIVSRKAGFMRMFEAAILEELLARQARPLTKEDYKKETARIDEETRAPEILACVKKHFGGDNSRYRRVFVRPILAQRFIRELVKFDERVQSRAYALRDVVHNDISKKRAFAEIGRSRGIAYSTAVYSLEEDAAAPAAEPWKRWSPFEASFIEENLKALKPGEVKFRPIEEELTLRFVRLISVTGKKYYFESLLLQKLSTEDFLKTVKKVPCRINDLELRDWTSSINGNPLLVPAEIAR